MVHTDLSGVYPFIGEDELNQIWLPKAGLAHKRLEEESEMDDGYAGWLRLPEQLCGNALDQIHETADCIGRDSDVLLVIGIGGSYLGARAVIELLCLENCKKKKTEVFFAGTSLSGRHFGKIRNYLKDRDFSINIISKSGTTTEPSIAFRLFYRLLKERYGASAAKRVYATTDANAGILRNLSAANGFTTFEIPRNIGGRYSVLTAAGLLPIAAAGIDIDALIKGAGRAQSCFSEKSHENPAWKYAAARQALYAGGKKIEVLSAWSPEYRYLGEWWKQLFGESEGKDFKGIFPAYLEMTADLHSMGQYVQQGERSLMETFLWLDAGCESTVIPYVEDDIDGLNYLAGKNLDYINRSALDGTKAAHISGGVPCVELKAETLSAGSLGALLYFFQISCAISGYISGVYPFNQPGVEAYKQNMFKLLGKRRNNHKV
ncbi:MAG: glucose-6-phosphate isomerase [Clostridiales bacterium]|nr:glucose-6-phosphate isomerase [Clostridiales bacterium]